MGAYLIVAGIAWAVIGLGNIFFAHYLASGHRSGPWFNIVVFVIPGLVLIALGELGRLAWWPRARTAPGGGGPEEASWQVIVDDPSRYRDVLRPLLRARRPDFSDAQIESLLDAPRAVIASGLSLGHAGALEREIGSANPTIRTSRARDEGIQPDVSPAGPDPVSPAGPV